jgi:Tfp pilus assembly protein PilX
MGWFSKNSNTTSYEAAAQADRRRALKEAEQALRQAELDYKRNPSDHTRAGVRWHRDQVNALR